MSVVLRVSDIRAVGVDSVVLKVMHRQYNYVGAGVKSEWFELKERGSSTASSTECHGPRG